MSIESRRIGSALLGLSGEPGLPVWYDITLEHDGSTVLAFTGAVQPASGRDLCFRQGQDLVLRIEDGPEVEVTLSCVEGDSAILRLARSGTRK